MKLNHRWSVVFMLWLVCFLSYADRQVIFVLFPLLKSSFSLNSVQLGLLSASFMLMYSLTGPLAGWVGDRLNRHGIIVCALLFWSVTTALTSLVNHYVMLLVTIGLAGVGEAFYFPAALSIIGDYHSVDTRSRAMASHQSGVYVGSILGGWLAGLIGEHIGWRLGFRYFGLAGIVLGLVLLFVLREAPRGLSDGLVVAKPAEASLWRVAKDLAMNPVARLLVLVFVGANFVAMVFTVWMPTYLYSRFHLSLSVAGISGTAYMQIASVAGVVFGGFAADAGVRRSHSASTRLRVMAGGMLFALPAIVVSGWARTVPMVLGGMAVFGFGKGIYEASLWCSLYDVVPVERRGASLGIMNSLGWLGAAIAEVIIGFASAHFGLGACFSATALIYLMIAIVLLYGARLFQRDRSSQVSAT